MATLTIRDALKSWIDEEVANGHYESADALIEEAVSAHLRASPPVLSDEALAEKLERARQSGISNKTLDEIFADAVRIVDARKAARG